MPKKAKNGDDAADAAEMTYEQALERLETIVNSMESGDLPLETLIQQYEEGMRLRKVCVDKLGEAEVKIKTLEESLAGELSLKPLTLEDDSE